MHLLKWQKTLFASKVSVNFKRCKHSNFSVWVPLLCLNLLNLGAYDFVQNQGLVA